MKKIYGVRMSPAFCGRIEHMESSFVRPSFQQSFRNVNFQISTVYFARDSDKKC